MLPVDEDMDASSYESFDDSDEDDDFEGEINVNWPAADESFIAVQDESIHAAKSLNVDRFNDEKTLSVRQNSNGSVASLSGVLDSAIVQPRQYSTVAIKDAAYSTYLAVLYYVGAIWLWVFPSLRHQPFLSRFTPKQSPLHRYLHHSHLHLSQRALPSQHLHHPLSRKPIFDLVRFWMTPFCRSHHLGESGLRNGNCITQTCKDHHHARPKRSIDLPIVSPYRKSSFLSTLIKLLQSWILQIWKREHFNILKIIWLLKILHLRSFLVLRRLTPRCAR